MNSPVKEITPQEAQTLVIQGWKLVDVRTPAEFASQHAVGAINLPLDQCTPASLKNLGGDSFAIICQAGGRSKRACQAVQEDSSIKTVSVLGGTTAWAAAGLSTSTDAGKKKVISLERQVRIVAGALVVAGVLLGYLVSPAWLILSAFVGSGLVFAGVTDTCGMAMLLAKMPWNN